MRMVLAGSFCLMLGVMQAFALPAQAAETYDLLFKQGTLNEIPKQQTLEYMRVVSVAKNPEYAERNSGEIELTFEGDDMARLQFVQADKHRNVGAFPATVGNPIIMYFVETVLRDVAHEAGGSPFYIRNRIKEALLQDVPVETETLTFAGTEIAAKTLTLHPFIDDKNRPRMGPYGDLSVTVTMSDDVPGWYLSLVATAPGKDGSDDYKNALTLLPPEPLE